MKGLHNDLRRAVNAMGGINTQQLAVLEKAVHTSGAGGIRKLAQEWLEDISEGTLSASEAVQQGLGKLSEKPYHRSVRELVDDVRWDLRLAFCEHPGPPLLQPWGKFSPAAVFALFKAGVAAFGNTPAPGNDALEWGFLALWMALMMVDEGRLFNQVHRMLLENRRGGGRVRLDTVRETTLVVAEFLASIGMAFVPEIAAGLLLVTAAIHQGAAMRER